MLGCRAVPVYLQSSMPKWRAIRQAEAVHIHGGTPIAGWFRMENPIELDEVSKNGRLISWKILFQNGWELGVAPMTQKWMKVSGMGCALKHHGTYSNRFCRFSHNFTHFRLCHPQNNLMRPAVGPRDNRPATRCWWSLQVPDPIHWPLYIPYLEVS